MPAYACAPLFHQPPPAPPPEAGAAYQIMVDLEKEVEASFINHFKDGWHLATEPLFLLPEFVDRLESEAPYTRRLESEAPYTWDTTGIIVARDSQYPSRSTRAYGCHVSAPWCCLCSRVS